MPSGKPPASTPDRIHAICILCRVDVILGSRTMFPYFGRKVKQVFAAITRGDANLKCARCAGLERQHTALH